MEEKDKEVAATPSIMPETQKVMDELREKGFEFEGDTSKEPPKEPEKKPEPDKKPEAEPKKEPEKELEKQPESEEEKEKRSERKPREPKMIPAWQAEIEKKKIQKDFDEKSAKEKQELTDAIKDLKSEIDKLKGAPKDKQETIDEWIDDLVEEKGVDVDSDFLKKFANELIKRVPQAKSELPPEFPKTIETIAKMEAKAEQEREDREYNLSFGGEVIPKLKEEYPQISDEEIKSIQEAMKKDYFSERLITLTAGEIYELAKNSFKDLVAPEKRPSIEKGKIGAGRSQAIKDYSNLTDEDYKNLSPEEREEANKFLLSQK